MPEKDLQKHINSEVRKQLEDHSEHLKIANKEMGIVQNDIAWLKNEFTEIKNVVKSTDNKVWGLLVGIVLILFRVFING